MQLIVAYSTAFLIGTMFIAGFIFLDQKGGNLGAPPLITQNYFQQQ